MPQARSRLRPDVPAAAPRPKTTWVLIQIAPRFEVLATADRARRLEREAAALVAAAEERRDRVPLDLVIRRAAHLVG